MSLTRIDLVAGARPNFMKIAPVHHRIAQHAPSLRARIVHTGQHYDDRLSEIFFQELNLPAPDVHLGVESAPTTEQTASIMEAYDRELRNDAPDAVMVVGDVNSTLACALAASHRGIPVIHLEAGLRCFDRAMPEEINRVLTDRLSDLLLTPSADAAAHLKREGIGSDRVRFVGNIMIDSLEALRGATPDSTMLEQLGVTPSRYGVVTLHRAANVDDHEMLAGLLTTLCELSRRLPLILPAHPRFRKNLEAMDSRVQALVSAAPLRIIDPLGYVDFLALEASARVVLTDSGGVQEECTVLGVPCLTLRENTERPITIHEGTNRLVGRSPERIQSAFEEAITLPSPGARRPRFWDGRTAERVVAAIEEFFEHGVRSPQPAPADHVLAFAMPVVSAHRSAAVRRELLFVAESGSWQDISDTDRLTDRIASYAEAESVVPCADIAGGLAAVRAHYSDGDVAVAGGSLPEDAATVLGAAAVPWRDLTREAPAGTGLVYVPPVQMDGWSRIDPADVINAAAKHPELPFVVDERWYEFTGSSVADAIITQENIIVLRSLGPAFGLHGLGAGFLLSSRAYLPAAVARSAEAVVLPLARRAAMTALIDQGYMREYVESRLASRDWLGRVLNDLGYRVRTLPGPHLYVEGDLPRGLAQSEGILAVGDGWLWAVGTPDQVEDLVAELEAERTHIRS
jgi:UDP-N-acetylglucosamine 2-epimerase (non-hydrolysing)